MTLFMVAINGILGELGNGVERSFFADDLAIYIITRNQRVANRALQVVTMGSGERTNLLHKQNSKHDI